MKSGRVKYFRDLITWVWVIATILGLAVAIGITTNEHYSYYENMENQNAN